MSDPSASSQPRLFCPHLRSQPAAAKDGLCALRILRQQCAVPPEYLAKEPARRPEPSVVQIPTYSATISTVHVPAGQVRRGGAGVMILLVVICLVGVGVVAAGGVFTTSWMNTSINQVFNDVATSAGDFPLTTLVPDLPLAQSSNIELQFGGGGSGAGQFDDPRGIAVDADDNIFVADYGSGRVQKFDPTGKFLQLINVPPDDNDNYICNATNYAGSLWVAAAISWCMRREMVRSLV
jgi:DNA-binding beta-propeller fold protein YncE